MNAAHATQFRAGLRGPRRPAPHEPQDPQARTRSKYLKCFDLAVDLRFTCAALSSFRLRRIVPAEMEALWPPHSPILRSRSTLRLWTRPVALVSGKPHASTEVCWLPPRNGLSSGWPNACRRG